MNRAARIHGLRTGITVLGIGLIIAAALGLNRRADERRNQAEATRLVEGLLAANTAKVSDSLASLKPFQVWADAQLQQEFQQAAAESDAKLHAGLALLSEGKQVDPALLKYLQDRLLTVSPAQIAPVRELMEPQKSELIPAYWTVAKDTAQPAALRFRAACALAGFDADSSEWRNPELTVLVAEQLVSVSPEYIGEFKELLRPVASQLVPALSTIFKDPDRGELAKTLTTSLLADYAAKDPETLTELVVAADAVSDKTLFPVLQQHQTAAVKNLEAVLARRLEPDWKDALLDPAWTEPSPAIRVQIESAHGMITERFAFCQDMPLPQFLDLAETLRASGYRPTRVRPWKALPVVAVTPGVVAGLLTEPPSPTAGLPSSGEQRDAGRPAVESRAGSGDPRTTEGSGDPRTTEKDPRTTEVSAIWTRDSKRWHIDPSLKPTDLPAPDVPAIKDGLLLTDIAPLPLADEKAEPQFIALWSEPANAEEQRRMLFDLTDAELTAAQSALTEQGFASQSTIAVRTDSSGHRRYTGIWSNQGASSELRIAYAGFELVHQPQWDLAVAPAAKLADPRDSLEPRIAAINLEIDASPENQQLRQTRGQLNYFLGNDAIAIQDFDKLFESGDRTEPLLRFRTLVLARLGRRDDAIECKKLHLEGNPSTAPRVVVEVLSAAWLGNETEALQHLKDYVGANTEDSQLLFNAASFAAVASSPSTLNENGSNLLKDKAIELLSKAVRSGFADIQSMKKNADLASLHSDHRFTELLSHLEPPATYTALWRADFECESKLLTAVPITSVAEQLKPMLVEGWRPFAITVDSSRGAPFEAAVVAGLLTEPPSPTAGLSSSGEQRDAGRPAVETRAGSGDPRTTATEPLCSLVLHRPLVPDAKKETLALQQAAAATSLLRLNAGDKVWPLFQDEPDPRLRSYVLHRVATYGVDPQSLFTQLQQESVVSRQRSLILGLGEFAKAKLLSPEQAKSVIADIAKRYADDPDPGIHGAVEWTLRQLGAEAAIAEVRTAYSTGTAVGERRWYLTKTRWKSPVVAAPVAVAGLPTEPPTPTAGLSSPGVQRDAGRPSVERSAGSGDARTTGSVGMAFAILDASDEFLMGSPVSEADRFQGPTGKNEIRHRRQIGRQLAFGTHEVTVAQFKAFRRDHQFDRTKAREEDSPANMITWYDAAAYCNWLSDQEGIPRDQWCYDPEQAFAEGMTLLPDYLQRTGYRLPSEAEWEYACRMGTTTARYFGETETLLGEYAWYTKTSGDKWMLPVGTLRPNGAGLFDMQGNVFEWCQYSAMFYGTDLAKMRDVEQTGELGNSHSRVLRGGSFYDFAALVRSANRHFTQPDSRTNNAGYRVARTYP